MSSVFRKDLPEAPKAPKKALDNYEIIRPEIVKAKPKRSFLYYLKLTGNICVSASFFLAVAVIFLYSMDAFRFSYLKTSAFNSYVYLRSKSEMSQSQSLVDSGAITLAEQLRLDKKVLKFGNNCTYYTTLDEARADATSVTNFLEEYQNLAQGRTEKMSSFNYFRYRLFNYFHVTPPVHWAFLDPSTEDWVIFPERKKKAGDVFDDI